MFNGIVQLIAMFLPDSGLSHTHIDTTNINFIVYIRITADNFVNLLESEIYIYELTLQGTDQCPHWFQHLLCDNEAKNLFKVCHTGL